MVSPARQAALKALISYEKNGVWPDAVLTPQLRRKMDPRDAGLCMRLCYGVLQQKLLLDAIVNKFSTTKTEKMTSAVRNILRMGAYQLVFMDKIPVHAAVNEGVDMARRHANVGASKLVNAVLRKIATDPRIPEELPGKDEVERLSIRHSHPEWFVRRMLEAMDAEESARFLDANNKPASLYIQRNPLIEGKDLELMFREEGREICPHPWLPDCWLVPDGGSVEDMPGFREGLFYVQDPAAKLASIAADAQEGMHVLDGCAAPGGKSIASAIRMHGKGEIHSFDLHEKKLNLIRENAERLGIGCIQTRAADGRVFLPEYENWADLVIADVPCSGFGVIRKKPEIRYKSPEEVAGLPAIQKAILQNLSRYVRPGGVLLYSTCTVLPEENEEIIRAFLAENGQFVPESFTLPGVGAVESGRVTLWPHKLDTDGFFICRMRKCGRTGE